MNQILNPKFRLSGLAAFYRAGLLILCFHLTASWSLAQSIISTFAGGHLPAVDGAPALSQNIDDPTAVISDGAGGFYFASDSQARVYRVAAGGTLTVVAGNGTSGFSGDGGPAASASLASPTDIAKDGAGNLYIADSLNHRVRKVTSAGIISTVAGNGTAGFGGDGGAAASALLAYPRGLAPDGAGNLYIADTSNNRIRKVTSEGIISTVAGTGVNGFGGDSGMASSALLANPVAVALDETGNLYITDAGNYRVRKVTPAGIISTVAGDGEGYYFYYYGCYATSTSLCNPAGIEVDAAGNLFIADSGNNRIRRVTPAGNATTVAGADRGVSGFSGDGGLATSALLSYPVDMTFDASGNLYIADSGNNRIRKVTPDGVISTVAGNGASHFSGDGGLSTSARLFNPIGVATDTAGNVYIADTENSRIRKVTPDGVISTVAGNGTFGFGGDNGLATSALLSNPLAVAVDTAGNLYIADPGNRRIRKVTPAGVISTVAGNGTSGSDGDGGPATSASFSNLTDLAVDASGNLYIADSGNRRIRKVTLAGIISTVAGNGTFGSRGDGGPATAASFSNPIGLAVDASGNLYIADSTQSRIRKVTPAGIISTEAGNGTFGSGGDGGPATSASLTNPTGLAVDASGNLYIADSAQSRIRKVTPDGIIMTVAGNGTYGFSGDGGAPAAAQLGYPRGIAVDAAGNLFVADPDNQRIRKIQFLFSVPTLTAIAQNFGAPGSTVNVTFTGSSFITSLTLDPGAGITASDIVITSDSTARATLTIASDAALGERNATVTTNLGTGGSAVFKVVPPFPDLTIASSHSGSFGVGFDGVFNVVVNNVGTSATTGPITITDNLPLGLTFTSGAGNGWTCSALAQAVTCSNPDSLAAGTSTGVTLKVAVSGAASSVTHTPSVAVSGDLISSNDAASDVTTIVASPAPIFQFSPTSLVAGQQGTVGITLPAAFPFDVTGTLTLSVLPSAVVQVDDPAVQFATGGREVAFTIPANSLQPQFASLSKVGPIGFQAGTVAASLRFSVTLHAGTIDAVNSTSMTVPPQAPSIQKINTDTHDGFAAVMTLISSTREVTQLLLTFNTTALIRLSCGSAVGCTASGSTLTFDVRSLFDTWFAGDNTFGSLTTLRIPLSIPDTVHGSVAVRLLNSRGISGAKSFPLP